MADTSEFNDKILSLETMFAGTVSAAVINTVLESCSGNVHLAADAIMNFSEEMSTPTPSITESIDNSQEVTSTLNVDAHIFHQPSIDQQSPSPQLSNQEIITQEFPTIPCPQPQVPHQSPTDEAPQPSTSAWQQPTSSIVDSLSTPFYESINISGALRKKPAELKPQKPSYTIKHVWDDQLKKILHLHNKGTRTLIIMRGLPGSGKSYLANHIVDCTIGSPPLNYLEHIFSADNYFMRRGVYDFKSHALGEAHAVNQKKVWQATNKGVSPIIVDNTNLSQWEMEPYIRYGVQNGYMIEFVEPNTWWARDVNHLAKRNIHGVPRDGIQRMLDRFERKITPDSVMKALRLTYPPNRIPPVLRNIPEFSLPGSPQELMKKENILNVENDKDQAIGAAKIEIAPQENPHSPGKPYNVALNHIAEAKKYPDNGDGMSYDKHELKLKKIIEAHKVNEQDEKLEQEWENGVNWESTTGDKKDLSPNTIKGFGSIASNPKPPREQPGNTDTEKLLEPISDDWTEISMFMQPWPNSNLATIVENPVQVETKSIGTGFEIEDMNEHAHRVLICDPRDINEGVPKNNSPKIPKAIVLDKSTSTHDNDFLAKKEVCKNKERHFREFRRMFKSVPSQSLREIFESCNCDVDWAVNLVFDGLPKSLENVNNTVNVSDDEDEGPVEDCNCLAGYNIIPDVAPIVKVLPTQEPEKFLQNSTPAAQKKLKREIKLSDNSLKLKRQIESNVTISDRHYSQHHLNLRKRRDNNGDGPERDAATVLNNSNTEDTGNFSGSYKGEIATSLLEATQGLFDFRDFAGPSTAQCNTPFLYADPVETDTESDSNKLDNHEPLVTINLGPEFLETIDALFGRKDFVYPENIQPLVKLPMSILQEINKHWAMSVSVQMDESSRQSEAMIKQDEDFARKIAAKEQEMSKCGKEPETPSFKEIMEMELAYSIYERGVAEWRTGEPQNMAARLSREKLYNLFPDMEKELLSEILMAHGYDFKETIQSLLVSTNQSSWLEDEKGVEKFIMNRETERKEKFLEEQRTNINEDECSYASDFDKPISLETVKFYRAQAEESRRYRDQYFEKARRYFNSDSPLAASFFSGIAALHTRMYEKSTSLAAAYLSQYHMKNNPNNDTLDLHFQYVPEAMCSVDIFLDMHIHRLRTQNLPYKEVMVITGRGFHSIGGPRIKPAASKRFAERGLTTKKLNAGLVSIMLRPTDMLTSELP